jgi:hypothetical protein
MLAEKLVVRLPKSWLLTVIAHVFSVRVDRRNLMAVRFWQSRHLFLNLWLRRRTRAGYLSNDERLGQRNGSRRVDRNFRPQLPIVEPARGIAFPNSVKPGFVTMLS